MSTEEIMWMNGSNTGLLRRRLGFVSCKKPKFDVDVSFFDLGDLFSSLFLVAVRVGF